MEKSRASNRGNTIGRGGQLRSNFSIRRHPALQREQAYDHLQVVQQSVIGFLAQNLLLLDQLVLLMRQNFFLGECLSQLGFRAPMSYSLAF
jgi:hypothetical protein